MSEQKFNPSDYLTYIKGQPYLAVRSRIQWFRSEFPFGKIETRLLSFENDRAIVASHIEAVTEDGQITGSATGLGSCTVPEFNDAIEKAETRAIGRALGALGFGTQFCDDFSDGPETGMLADAPGIRPQQQPQGNYQQQPRQNPTPIRNQQGGGGQQYSNMASDAQLRKIGYEASQKGIDKDEVDQYVRGIVGKPMTALTKQDASRVIDDLLGNAPRGNYQGVPRSGGNSEPEPDTNLNDVPF